MNEKEENKSFSHGVVLKGRKVTITCNNITKTFDTPQTVEDQAKFTLELQELGLDLEQIQELIAAIATKQYIQQNIFAKTIKELAEELKMSPGEVALTKATAFSEKPIAKQVSDIYRYEGLQFFYGELQITGIASAEARHSKLTFTCGKEDCDNHECPLKQGITIDFRSLEQLDFFSYYFFTNSLDKPQFLSNYAKCNLWQKYVTAKRENEVTIIKALVADLKGTEVVAQFINGPKCDLSKLPSWIDGEGFISTAERNKIIINIFAFSERAQVLPPSPEEVEKARSILQKYSSKYPSKLEYIFFLGDLLRKKSQLKGKEATVGFVANLILDALPVWVKTPEGPPNLPGIIIEIGHTTTAKSQRDISFVNWVGAGSYKKGRQTEAGLTVGLEKIERLGYVARKGILPSSDLSSLILDNMPPDLLLSQLEALRNGLVEIYGIRSARFYARTRVKLLQNPRCPITENLHPCVALKMYDKRIIARSLFAIVTAGEKNEVRYNPEIYQLSKEEEELLEAARIILRYNMAFEVTFEIKDEKLWAKVMHLSKELDDTFGNEEIPLLLRNIPHKISALAYAFSLLSGKEKVGEEDIEVATEWLHNCALKLELDKFTQEWKEQNVTTESEIERIKEKLKELIEKEVKEVGGTFDDVSYVFILRTIAKSGSVHLAELQNEGISRSTLLRRIAELKQLGLLKTEQGYRLTSKGIAFLKATHLLSDLKFENKKYETRDTSDTGFRGNRALQDSLGNKTSREESDQKQPLTPEVGITSITSIKVENRNYLETKTSNSQNLSSVSKQQAVLSYFSFEIQELLRTTTLEKNTYKKIELPEAFTCPYCGRIVKIVYIAHVYEKGVCDEKFVYCHVCLRKAQKLVRIQEVA
jgi:DNA-binding HxlR family transcriptional regulator